MSDLKSRRKAYVQENVGLIRNIAQGTISREKLAAIRAVLIEMAKRKEFFATDEFQPPPKGEHEDIAFYILSEDEDGKLPLYLSANRAGKEYPPHNHGFWAVIAGISGIEENRLYHLESKDGAQHVVYDKSIHVQAGEAVALMPDDIHSIAVPKDGPEVALQFRMYGVALEQQGARAQFTGEGVAKANTQKPAPLIVRLPG